MNVEIGYIVLVFLIILVLILGLVLNNYHLVNHAPVIYIK